MHMENRNPHTPSAPENPALPELNARDKLLADSVAAVDSGRFGPGFVKPAYGSYCFSALPGFIEEILTGRTDRVSLPPGARDLTGNGIERVALVFFDSFGWESFRKFAPDSRLLKAFSSDGLVLKTTSQFPSTTAAHVTTMGSGEPVYVTGVCEWFYYEPAAGQVIKPFKLSPYNLNRPHVLLEQGHEISALLPRASFTSDLFEQGINSFSYGPKQYFPSPYNLHLSRQAKLIPHASVKHAVSLLTKTLGSSGGREYHYLYVDIYDGYCHKYGPHSPEADRTAQLTLQQLDRITDAGGDGKTLVIMTADHGQIGIPRETEVHINVLVPEIKNYLARSPSGDLIRFGGGARDMLLYTRGAQAAEELRAILRSALSEKAEIYTRDEAAALGLLGPLPLTQRFSERIGDLLVLPHPGHSVTWNEPGVYEREFFSGHHGGLSLSEMETQICMLKI